MMTPQERSRVRRRLTIVAWWASAIIAALVLLTLIHRAAPVVSQTQEHRT